MPTRIALFRSVNVLDKNMIKMPELTMAFEKAGFKKVRTNGNTCKTLLEMCRE